MFHPKNYVNWSQPTTSTNNVFLIGIFQSLNLFKTKSFNKKNAEHISKKPIIWPKKLDCLLFLKKTCTHGMVYWFHVFLCPVVVFL